MTTPLNLLDEESTKLKWEQEEAARQERYQKQQAQDRISPDAASLDVSNLYDRLENIKLDSATATAGSIASDNTRRQREAAIRAADIARQQAAAQQGAYDAMGNYAGGFAGQYGAQGAQGSYGADGGWGSGGAQGVANVLRAAGFSESQVPIFMAIAMAESSWRANATHKNSNGTIDQGLFQINSVHKGNSWYPANPFDALQSAKAAKGVFDMQGLGAWTVYKSGAYKQYLPKSVPPIMPYVANTGGNTGLMQAAVGQAQSYSGVPAPGVFNGGNYGPRTSSGYAANTAAARNFVLKSFPGVSSIGGLYGGSVSGSDHPHGKAIDIMIGNYKSQAGITNGTNIANWFIQNPKAFGVKYIIWRDRIWQNGVWKSYGHPTMKNDTGQHRDHVHVSFL